MVREARENELIPVPANDTRERTMGGFVIRESLLKKFKKGIDAGLAFPDAAQAAGIPYEFVVSALGHDDDIRKWFKMCVGRKSLIRAEDAFLLPETKTTLQLKTETVNLAMAAGLGHRFAEAIAHIRPIDEDGEFNREHMNVLIGMGKLVFGMMPNESHNANREVIEDRNAIPRDEKSVMQELVMLREERLKKEAAEKSAIEARMTGGRSLKGPDKHDAPG